MANTDVGQYIEFQSNKDKKVIAHIVLVMIWIERRGCQGMIFIKFV